MAAPVVTTTETNLSLPKPTISSANTTLIGDYVAAGYSEFHIQWCVQAFGNATFGSLLQMIKSLEIVVNRRYVFFEVGGNQIRSADRNTVFQNALDLAVATRERNPDARIFFVGILPRPVENDDAKPFIAKFNRWMVQAVNRISLFMTHVSFLPVHLAFIQDSKPRIHLFNPDDRLTLNEAGLTIFKRKCFELAGFARNV